MQSQQLMWQGRTRELPISSKQQPGSFAQRRPVGIQAGLGALVLAALCFTLIVGYAVADALTTRNGYAEMALQREIEDLQAQNALLRYQIYVAKSQTNIQEVAERLGMRPADPMGEVDYVLLPEATARGEIWLAAEDGTAEPGGIGATLAGLATEVMTGAGGLAEASTGEGHPE